MSNSPHNCIRVSVEGGPATGKTRFLVEIQRIAATLGLVVVRGFTPADPHGIVMRRTDLPPDASPAHDAPAPNAQPNRARPHGRPLCSCIASPRRG